MPSQTELLYTLGLDTEVAGITKFCVHPASWFREKTLQPDLIIANKEENDREQVETLASRYPVWISDVKTLPDALAMIRSVGELISRPKQALALAAAIEKGFGELSGPVAGLPPMAARPQGVRTAYFIWRKPWMAAGGGTFIDDIPP